MTGQILHLISDSTGETAQAVARACLVQFEGLEVTEQIWSMVRSAEQLESVIAAISDNPGLVVYTLLDPLLQRRLQEACWALQLPCVAVLEPVLSAFAMHWGAPSVRQPGRQHTLDADYFKRIAAMEFALAHDDGQGTWDLKDADVILLGVSRTSKTPTCLYLANRGVKAANIPLVLDMNIPDEVLTSKALIVGLTNTPSHLVELRRARLRELHEARTTAYIDLEQVQQEVNQARRIFSKQGWPVIDVSRRAIEETAAEIMTLLHQQAQERVL
jgi:[pyruvate, water dikinase]-phosphate phosphotransferase / [pyruvate, water dikinase] kinase